jgi:hypothetical protein
MAESMDYQDIEKRVLPEIKLAEDYAENRADRRNKSWDRYKGKPLGNEVKGRSRFVTREVLDTIEWMMPYFIRTFASGDPKVSLTIEGQEPWVGKALMQEMIEQIDSGTPTLFLLVYTWIKDALVSDTSFVKERWEKEYDWLDMEIPPEIDENTLQLYEQDDQYKIVDKGRPVPVFSEASTPSEGLPGGGGPVFTMPLESTVYRDVKVKQKVKVRDCLVVENMPHMEFLAHPKSKDINDKYGKGHKAEIELHYLKKVNEMMGGDYFKNLDEIIVDTTGRTTDISDDGDADTYFTDEKAALAYTLTGHPVHGQDPKGMVNYIEWYTREDVNGDGFLEDIICFFADNKLIRWEINEEGMISFSAAKPIIDPFKFYGTSYADLIIEIQNLKTMIVRRVFDNFDFQNLGRWLVDPSACVDRRALLDNRPNSIVTGKKDGVTNLFQNAFSPSAGISLLEYVDKMKENRTGVHGLQPQTSSNTATEIHHLETTTIQRLELIGRIFAEVGLKDFYVKCAKLYQLYLEDPFKTKINGVEVEVTPDMIQGKIIATVDMGVEASIGIQEAQKIQMVLGVLGGLNAQYPGLMGPKQIHSICRKFINATGFKQIDDFVATEDEFTQATQQAQQAQSEMQQKVMQLENELKQAELMIKAKEVEVKSAKAEADKEIRSAGVIQKDRASQRDMEARLADVEAKLTGIRVKRESNKNDNMLKLLTENTKASQKNKQGN